MSFWEIVLRLGAATLVGGAIGLNRDLHGKATGVRTLGLVSLASALIVLGVMDLIPQASADPNPISRVVQGVLTGVGFLGAGVILHNANGMNTVRGLTTAACTWLTACVGMICGIGNWRLLVVAVFLVFLLLLFGGPIERMCHKRWGRHADAAPPGDSGSP
jgi:putative Mg2+ transporter-C (MgtC) family protein